MLIFKRNSEKHKKPRGSTAVSSNEVEELEPIIQNEVSQRKTSIIY